MLLDIIGNTSTHEHFDAGQTIFRQGDSVEAMYVIEEGEVDIVVDNEIVETVGRGGILGEMAMINIDTAASEAVAKTACNLRPINRGYFALLLRKRLDFAIEIMRVVANRPRSVYRSQTQLTPLGI